TLETTSAQRSVPDWCVEAVMMTFPANERTCSSIRWSSVATITSERLGQPFTCSYTRCIMDFPPISTNGLPGKREDSYRAGIIPIIFMFRHHLLCVLTFL